MVRFVLLNRCFFKILYDESAIDQDAQRKEIQIQKVFEVQNMPYTLSSLKLRKNYLKHLQMKYFVQNPEQRKPSLRAINADYRGYQAHHIIPREICKKYLANEDELKDCDNAWNCVMLPNNEQAYVLICHIGSHPRYSEWVESLLEGHTTLSDFKLLANFINAQIEELNDGETAEGVNRLKSVITKLYEDIENKRLEVGDLIEDNDNDDYLTADE